MDYEIQTTKWLKLDLLEHRLRALEANEIIVRRQLGMLVSSFICNLEEIRKSLELKLIAVLSNIGVVRCSTGVATLRSWLSHLLEAPSQWVVLLGGRCTYWRLVANEWCF